jgi:hypothetical protein
MIELTMDEVKKAIFINIPLTDHACVNIIKPALPNDPRWINLSGVTDGLIWWMLIAPGEIDFIQQASALLAYCASKNIMLNWKWDKAPSTAVETVNPTFSSRGTFLPLANPPSMPSQATVTPVVVAMELPDSTSMMLQSLNPPQATTILPAPPRTGAPVRQSKNTKEQERRAIENDSLKRIRNELTEVLENPGNVHHGLLLFCLNGSRVIPPEKVKLLLLMANYIEVLHHGIPQPEGLPVPTTPGTARPATMNEQPEQSSFLLDDSPFLPPDSEGPDVWETNPQGLERSALEDDLRATTQKRGRFESSSFGLS